MKNYTITVNGNVYDVTVEEKGSRYCTGCSGSTSCSSKGSTGSGSESSSTGRSRKYPGKSGSSWKSIQY